VSCCFRDAGHILGSAIIEIWITEGEKTQKIVASGDLGQPGRPILRDPTRIADADVLLIESTYGDRNHKDLPATLDELAEVVETTLHRRKGNVIVPAFAVGRTQELIYHLHQLTEQGRLKNLEIFVDSPMAVAVTKITQKHFELFDAEAHRINQWHAQAKNIPKMHFVADVAASMALNQVRAGAIIISASGMCDAGRIKHHLRHNLGRPECSVLITGYQAGGTLGRRLVDGEKVVRIFGEEVAVRASIHTLGGFSAHADLQALMAWAGGFEKPPGRTFVVHGEAAAANNLAEQLRTLKNWTVDVPEIGQSYAL
jgi:metallo-beta-lactamase family protein